VATAPSGQQSDTSREVIAIDILHLVDRLESLLNESRRIPFTSNRLVNEELFLNIIDQMRISIPEEIKKGKRIQQERERLIAQANEEAERIVALAREKAEHMLSEHELTQQAERRAQTIIERAQREAETFKADADSYTYGVLSQLEDQLSALLKTVRNGLRTIEPAQTNAPATQENKPPGPEAQ